MQKNLCLFALALFLCSVGRSQSGEVSLVPLNTNLGNYFTYIGPAGNNAFFLKKGKWLTKAKVLQIDVKTGEEVKKFSFDLPKKPKGIKRLEWAGSLPLIVTEQTIFCLYQGVSFYKNNTGYLEYYLQAYDLEGNLEGPLIPMFQITGDYNLVWSKSPYYFSKDSSKVGIRFDPGSYFNLEPSHGFGLVIDLKQRKALSVRVWKKDEKDYSPWPDQVLIDNEGGRYFISSQRDEPHFGATRVAIWAVQLIYLRPGAPIEQAETYTVDFGSKHVISSRIEWDGEHILFSGGFEDKPGEGAAGVFFHRTHKDSISFFGVRTIRFPDSLHHKFIPETNPHYKKRIFDSSMVDDRLMVKHISRMPNQGFFIIAQRDIRYEESYENIYGTYSHPYIQMSDYVLIRLDSEGKLVSLDFQDLGGKSYYKFHWNVVHASNGETAIFSERKDTKTLKTGYWHCRYTPGESPVFAPSKYNLGLPYVWNGERYLPYFMDGRGWAKLNF